MKQLETKRVLMRPFEAGDYPLILEISSDPDTVKYLYYWGRPGMTPEDDARRFLSYALGSWEERPIRAREYCLVCKETGESMGDGSIEWDKAHPGTAEIGWILLPRFRRQGYVTEMGRELLRYGFDELGADRIIAHCDTRNMPSYAVMERLGMRRAQMSPGVRPAKEPGGPLGDEYTYEMLREEWLAAQGQA